MSDDLSKKKPQDASKISTKEAWEVKYWCNVLGVSESQLKNAVAAAGNSAAAVRKYLGK